MYFPIESSRINKEKEWISSGLQCVVVKAVRDSQHRCGYVRVPAGHLQHGKSYDDVPVEVHGGLTFGKLEPCEHEDGQGYWYGFDCAHCGDALYEPGNEPEFVKRLNLKCHREPEDHYWTLEEVVAETEALAKQLASLSR
jgi:hypothetical protein